MCGWESCEIVLRLALEALAQLLVGGQVLRQDLDGDGPLEARVPRPVDLAHPARAERREDLVGTEPGTCRQRQIVSCPVRSANHTLGISKRTLDRSRGRR